MTTFTTWDGLMAYLQEIRDNDSAPLYEAKADSWRNKYSEVDLIITDKGPVEQHNILYDGNTYEITITTREYARKTKEC